MYISLPTQIRKMVEYGIKGKHQNSLLLTKDFSQKLTQLSEGVSDLCRRFTIQTFCDLSHTYPKQVTNVSPECFCHPTMGNFDVSAKTLLKQHRVYVVQSPVQALFYPIFSIFKATIKSLKMSACTPSPV